MSTVVKEYPLANIARVEFITEEDTPKTYSLNNVAEEASVEVYLSEGIEEILRVKNEIKAQNITEDIAMGYNINLVQATMIPEILALVDGGEWDAEAKTYKAPVIGSPVNRTSMTVNIYAEVKDGNAETIHYVKFVYKHAKGTPLEYTQVEGEFYSPEMTLRSRPRLGESPVEFEIMDELPA